MKYLLLIYTPESQLRSARGSGPKRRRFSRTTRPCRRNFGAKAWRGRRRDCSRRRAARTQVQSADRRVAHDGPFAETKEQLGGYYLVEAPDMAAAEAWAARIPQIEGGKIEIRPIMQSYD
jgi:hypothetical protein